MSLITVIKLVPGDKVRIPLFSSFLSDDFFELCGGKGWRYQSDVYWENYAFYIYT